PTPSGASRSGPFGPGPVKDSRVGLVGSGVNAGPGVRDSEIASRYARMVQSRITAPAYLVAVKRKRGPKGPRDRVNPTLRCGSNQSEIRRGLLCPRNQTNL